MRVELNGQEVLHRKLATGTQHTWYQITSSGTEGEHLLTAVETNSLARVSETLIVTSDLWVAIAFHAPPARLGIDVFDHEIGFM
jgi:hypothetical protein